MRHSTNGPRGIFALVCYTFATLIAVAQPQAVTVQYSEIILDNPVISTLTEGSLSIFRDAKGGPWTANSCFDLTVNNPYVDSQLFYKTFLPESPPVCQLVNGSGTQIGTVDCSVEKSDTLRFKITSINASETNASRVKLLFTNLKTPFSEQQLSAITVMTFPDANCEDPNPKQSRVSGQSIQKDRMTSVEVFSSSTIVGDSSFDNELIVRFVPNKPMSPTGSGKIEIEMPFWFDVSGSTQPMYDPSALNKCRSDMFTVTNSGLQGQRISITYENMLQQYIDQTAGSEKIQINCKQFRNPIYPHKKGNFKVYTYDDETSGTGQGQQIIEDSDEALLDATDYKEAEILENDFLVTPEEYKIGEASTWYVILNSPVPLEYGCYIRVYIPGDLKYSFNSVQGSGVFQPSSNDLLTLGEDMILTESNSPSDYVTVRGCNRRNGLGATPSGTLRVNAVTTPGQLKDSEPFFVEIFKDEENLQKIAELYTGVRIEGESLIPGDLFNLQFAAQNKGVQEKTGHLVSFTIEHDLTQNSMIEVRMPEELTLGPEGSEVIIVPGNDSISATVGIVNGQKINIYDIFKDMPVPNAPHDINFRIDTSQNQASAKSAGNWEVSTYRMILDNYYLVDQGFSPTSFVATTGRVNAVADIEVSNAVTYGRDSIYTLKFRCDHLIPMNGFIKVTVPPSVVLHESYTLARGSCSTGTCMKATKSSFYMLVNNKLEAGEIFEMRIGGATNPRSTQPTGFFTIQTFDTDQESEIDSGFEKITQMTDPGLMQSFSVLQSNVTNGALNTYQFSLQTNIPLMDGDRLQFDVPAEIVPPKTSSEMDCRGRDNLRQVRCTVSGQSMIVNFEKVSGNTGTFSWTVDNMKNPPSTIPSGSFSGIVVTDSNRLYHIAKYDKQTSGVTNKLPANILLHDIRQDLKEPEARTQYRLLFTPTNEMPNDGSIQVTWPTQITLDSTSSCSVMTFNNFNSGTYCVINTASNTILIEGVFRGQEGFRKEITITISNVVNPDTNKPGGGFTIQTYADDQQVYFIDTLSDDVLIPMLDCDYPCQTCDPASPSDCTSCWQDDFDGTKQFLMKTSTGGECRPWCDDGFTSNGSTPKTCVQCDDTCATCVDQGKEGDTKRCLQCDTQYPLRVRQDECTDQCSQGFFQSSGYCSACRFPCLGCEKTESTCTACNPASDLPALYSNQCIEECPPSHANVANECKMCDSPCSTCQDQTDYCLSCDGTDDTKFVFSGICYADCPSGTTADQENMVCLGCLTGCSLCDFDNPATCRRCDEGLYVYEGNCEAACPEGFKVNSEGTACVNSSLLDATLAPFPFLISAFICGLVCLGTKLKKKKVRGHAKMISEQNTITSFIALTSPLQFLAAIFQTILGMLFATKIQATICAAIVLFFFILNVCFQLVYQRKFNTDYLEDHNKQKLKEKTITTAEAKKLRKPKDEEFGSYVKKHKCTNISISTLTMLFAFKYNKMYYSKFLMYDMFKAKWTNYKDYRKMMTIFCCIHILGDSALIILDISSLIQGWEWTQLHITIVETLVLSILGLFLGIWELYKLKDILKYVEPNARARAKKGLINIQSAPAEDYMDKDSRETMMKGLLAKVKNNKDLFLNNKLDELLQDFGDRRCKSMIELGTGWPKEEDPRKIITWPMTPEHLADYDGKEFKFGKEDMYYQQDDNVYAEAAVKKEATDEGVQGDMGAQEFFDAQRRKQGDLLTPMDDDEEIRKRKNKGKRRGRKNKYYAQIDAEDDEEAEAVEGSEEEDNAEEDNLAAIKEQEEEEERLRQKLEEERQKQEAAKLERKKKLEEAERLRLEAEQKEEEARLEAERLEEERRLAQEKEDLEKMAQMDEARRQMQLEEMEDRKRREEADHLKKKELQHQSQLNRAAYDEEEARRLADLKEEEDRLRKEAEDAEAKARAELDEERRKQREEQDRLRAERDAMELLSKKEQLELEEKLRQEAKDRKQKEMEDEAEERRLRASELAEEKRRQKEEEDRLRKEADEAERQRRLLSEDERRKREDDELARRKAQLEEEERLRLDAAEIERQKRIAQEEQDRLDRIAREEDERRARIAKEDAERAARIAGEDLGRRQREEEDRIRREDEERRRQDEERRRQEDLRLKGIEEEAETRRREEEEARRKKDAEDSKKQLASRDDLKSKAQTDEEDQVLRAREAELKRQREEDERRRREQEAALRKQKDEEDQILRDKKANELAAQKAKAKSAAEKKRIEAEQNKLEEERRLAELARKRAEDEEKARLQREEEERIRKEDEERRRRAAEEAARREQELRDEEERIAAEAREKERLEREARERKEAEDKLLEEKIISDQEDQDADKQAVNESKIEVSDNLLKNFRSQEDAVQCPPDANARNFNENDILGDLDRDDSGNIIVLQDDKGNNKDKAGNPTNMRGYLTDPKTGDIIENHEGKKMFDAKDMDDRGEVPAPFCIEKFNFNPHNLIGDFDYVTDDRTGHPVPSLLQTKQGFFVDKKGRRVNKHGWLVQGGNGHLVDKNGRKKFDRRQLQQDGDLPKLFNYNGKRFDVKDVIGQFDKDAMGNIMPQRSQDGKYLVDNLGREVNEKGYLVDQDGNIIDKDGKKIFQAKHLKNGEFPKIFPFTKFNIKNVQGDYEMDPLGNPILDKDQNGNLIDRKGRVVNPRGYLINDNGDVIDKRGKLMFDKIILDKDQEIPKVFRTGLLKSDTGSDLSRIMSEIEKNHASEFDQEEKNMQNQLYDEIARGENGSGNTSVDSMMEDTPANYNIPNQRFDAEYEDYPDVIPEEEGDGKGGDGSQSNPRRKRRQRPANQEDDELLQTKKRKKKKKRKVKKATLEFLEPTDREISMANAYGGIAKGQFRRPGIKYDKDRLSKRLQTPGYYPNGGDQLQQLASSVSGFNRGGGPPPLDNMSQRGPSRRPKRNQLVGGENLNQSDMVSTDGRDLMNQSYQSRGDGESQWARAAEGAGRGGRGGPGETTTGGRKMNRAQIDELRKRQKQMKKKGGSNMKDGDFEKMFGKDIDQFLEDSDWDIESFDKMSQFSRGTARSAANDLKLKAMEKVYLQRIETQMQKGGVAGGHNTVTHGNGNAFAPGASTAAGKTRKVKNKKPPAFREFQDRFVDQPDFIHKGEILEFETEKQGSSTKKSRKFDESNSRLFTMGMGADQNYRQSSVQKEHPQRILR